MFTSGISVTFQLSRQDQTICFAIVHHADYYMPCSCSPCLTFPSTFQMSTMQTKIALHLLVFSFLPFSLSCPCDSVLISSTGSIVISRSLIISQNPRRSSGSPSSGEKYLFLCFSNYPSHDLMISPGILLFDSPNNLGDFLENKLIFKLSQEPFI